MTAYVFYIPSFFCPFLCFYSLTLVPFLYHHTCVFEGLFILCFLRKLVAVVMFLPPMLGFLYGFRFGYAPLDGYSCAPFVLEPLVLHVVSTAPSIFNRFAHLLLHTTVISFTANFFLLRRPSWQDCGIIYSLKNWRGTVLGCTARQVVGRPSASRLPSSVNKEWKTTSSVP